MLEKVLFALTFWISSVIPSSFSDAPTTFTTWLSACRTRRGGATRCPSRCAPWGRGRATGTCPRGRPVRAHRWNRCGRRRRPRARTRSCPASRACTWPRRFRSWPRSRRPAPRRLSSLSRRSHVP